MRARGIKAGDIVQVVRDCCGKNLGRVYVVESVSFANESECGYCNTLQAPCSLAHWAAPKFGVLHAFPVAWLKRFDPPAEPVAEIEALYCPQPVEELVTR